MTVCLAVTVSTVRLVRGRAPPVHDKRSQAIAEDASEIPIEIVDGGGELSHQSILRDSL